MKDKTYTFERDGHTVVVTVPRHDATHARARLIAIFSAGITLTLVVGIGFPPFLIVPIMLSLALAGKLASLEDAVRAEAKRAADAQFEYDESERWRAARVLGS